MNWHIIFDDKIFITLLAFVALAFFGLILTLTLYYLKTTGVMKPQRKLAPGTSRSQSLTSVPVSSEIRGFDRDEILSPGRFTAAEGKLEYRTLTGPGSGEAGE
jgi:hypothetical protein